MRSLDLKPTSDLVFKLLFTSGPDAHDALISLLTAVLRPASPIASVVIENPDILPEMLTEKQIVLDIKVLLDDGSRCDVEMQASREAALPERMTVYGARAHGSQLAPGASYGSLRPVIVVVFLAYPDDRFRRFHASYRMREDADGNVLTDTLVTHVVSLLRLHTATDALRPEEAKLLRWSELLLATTREEAERAAGDDPAMLKATAILDRLQDDPHARQLADALELARRWRPIEEAAQRAEARAEGLEAGREQGLEAGLRRAVLAVCKALSVEVPQGGDEVLHQMDAAALDRWLATIETTRGWPG